MTRTLQRQHGNTLTGIIIGLIIGLVIAVIVALAITKGATPFTDKSGKLGKMSEPTAGQASDPNKPLYGNKEAARQANRQITEKAKPSDDPLGDAIAALKPDPTHKPEPTPATPAVAAAPSSPGAPAVAAAPAPPAAPAPLAPAAPVAPVARPATPAARVAPAARAAAAAAAPAAPAAPAAVEDKVVYYLQAGAFREIKDAENTRAKLALLGFEAAITERVSDAGVLHRVRVGPYGQVESMNKARAKLLDSGIDVAIVRNQK